MFWTKLEQKEAYLNQQVGKKAFKQLEGALYKDHLIILETVHSDPTENKLLFCWNLSILLLINFLIFNRHQLMVNLFHPAGRTTPFCKKSGCL